MANLVSRPTLVFGGTRFRAGTKGQVELPLSRSVIGTMAPLPARVIHGRHDGPSMWLSAAIHGDEICGVEIIRRVLTRIDPRSLRGTIYALPIVNIYGFIDKDRYLPDRRDLNRSFPGSPRGSTAARIAHLMMTQVVARCSVGIDLHTGSGDRFNLPQIRGIFDDTHTTELAAAFGAPVSLQAQLRDGSLRAAAEAVGATVLVFEGGEANRFDETVIETGVIGVLRCLQHLGMVQGTTLPPAPETLWCGSSSWARASRSGILQLTCRPGDRVERGQLLGRITDAMGRHVARLSAHHTGVIVGQLQSPLVNQGDAAVHIALPRRPSAIARADAEAKQAGDRSHDPVDDSTADQEESG